jgi:hypothetical protein
MFNQPILTNHQQSPDSPHLRKFLRRPDLTPHIRLHIAVVAFMAKSTSTWGTITQLAKQYVISRTFVYMLAFCLEYASPHIFGFTADTPYAINKRHAYYYIVSLRLEGKCSIESIAVIMKQFGVPDSSVGFISQFLARLGASLPDTLSNEGNEAKVVVFASDEIFSRSTPILVTVDPCSSAILRIELADTRKIEDWKRHWECIEKNEYYAAYLVSDEGKGLCGAQKEALIKIFRQPDTYHAIAHQLGKWVNILENVAYKAIEAEDECYKKLDSAKSDAVIEKRITACEESTKRAEEKIALYDNLRFLYSCLIRELFIFDEEGNLRDRSHSEETIIAALDLVELLGHEKINDAVCKVRSPLPDLLNYFEVAKEILSELMQFPMPQEALRALCCAWQWQKGKIKAKKSPRKHYCASQEAFYLELAELYLQDDYLVVKEQVYTQLDRIVQSSAMVECINSIIRPYLNASKNHVSQGMLNLIMFYHNHRRYLAGKRKGSTPMELLTGKKQEEDWIDLLFATVKKNPDFFASLSIK